MTWRPYGRREPVLRDISLSLAPGERVLLAGPSGSGKSTLLRAIAGLLETADAGELTGSVLIDGHAPGARAGEVGLVLQEPGAGVVASSIGRDVAFGLENVGMPRADMPAVVRSAVGAVGLPLPLDTPTGALSGGETQRLALAGALALAPTVLLLDEPTAMLDPGHAAQVRTSVGRALAAYPITTVVVEHVLGPWVDLVDRLLVLDAQGALVADGPVRDVLAGERERLLDMGIWVPDAPPPTPLVSGALSAAPASARGQEVTATPLTIERTVRLLDGSTRTSTAARLEAELAPAPGTATALVGPSGSGKSTVLLAFAGALAPSDGAVTAGDEPVSELSTHALAGRLGWVPQWSSSTILGRTVLDEVLVTSRALGEETPERVVEAHALLSSLGLGHLETADPRELSGGEQRRLAIASAILHQPPLLLADEPTVGQDRHTWAAVVGLLDSYRRAGGAVLVSTHDAAVVERSDGVVELTPPPKEPPPPQPRRVLAAHAGPLALLVSAIVAIPAGILPGHWHTSLVVLAVQVALACLALSAPGVGARPSGRLRRVVLRLVPGLLGGLSVGWSTWLLGGHDTATAVTAGLRVVIIVLPSAVLLPLVDPDRLGDHLAQRLRMPARPVVALAAALQRVHTLGAVWSEISLARRVRGLGTDARRPVALVRDLATATFGLLVRTLRMAADLAVAMDARGFASASRRTWFAPAPWRPADTLVVVASLIPIAAALLLTP
ncbi:ATP-binding cassette domain-containing protein [Knoellia sp. Soil729]|uniref:ATP-binding cassette domain-containing protein n=1 Tax=Knoellia sp. Soil729 TaxID=1736394 RepID=UPI0006F91350|nr:ATP-binding cassette domain-containing protein [Knoellia sp. Soil729]KRE40485.1 ABC transporter ATP-binding protein [Knoellia sp. Soil729]